MHILWCFPKYHLIHLLNKHLVVLTKPRLLHKVIPCITPRCGIYIDYVNGPSIVVQCKTHVTAYKDPEFSLNHAQLYVI